MVSDNPTSISAVIYTKSYEFAIQLDCFHRQRQQASCKSWLTNLHDIQNEQFRIAWPMGCRTLVMTGLSRKSISQPIGGSCKHLSVCTIRIFCYRTVCTQIQATKGRQVVLNQPWCPYFKEKDICLEHWTYSKSPSTKSRKWQVRTKKKSGFPGN